jgi:hypothetical protein
MKPAWICALLLYAFAFSQYARAEAPDISRPHWVIIATVIDKTSGKPILQTELDGGKLELDSAGQCYFILRKLHPVADEQLTMILKCSKVAPPAELL